MPSNINAVVLTGNLTRDPELQSVGSGSQLCRMRLAVNTRVKRDNEWQDKANYFDIAAFGKMAENCHRYLSKGRPIAVTGRLDWNEWQDKDGNNRQGVSIIADNVQFLDDGKRDGPASRRDESPPAVSAGVPADDFSSGAAAAGADEDIPF
jgi:single-strand DNA-binding protein